LVVRPTVSHRRGVPREERPAVGRVRHVQASTHRVTILGEAHWIKQDADLVAALVPGLRTAGSTSRPKSSRNRAGPHRRPGRRGGMGRDLGQHRDAGGELAVHRVPGHPARAWAANQAGERGSGSWPRSASNWRDVLGRRPDVRLVHGRARLGAPHAHSPACRLRRPPPRVHALLPAS